MNILLALILLINTAFFAALIYAFLKFRAVKSQIQDTIREFVTPAGENKLSPLGQTVEAISVQVARAIVAQAKTTFMGEASAQSRAAGAIAGDIAQDQAGQNPLLSGILSQFPSVRKTLRRNPQLTDLAIQMLAKKFLGAGGAGGPWGPGPAGADPAEVPGNGQVKFNL